MFRILTSGAQTASLHRPTLRLVRQVATRFPVGFRTLATCTESEDQVAAQIDRVQALIGQGKYQEAWDRLGDLRTSEHSSSVSIARATICGLSDDFGSADYYFDRAETQLGQEGKVTQLAALREIRGGLNSSGDV